ncbi:hypothetical protein [Hwangdonia seohaensis]|uniref:DUF2607 family protein n=1 Tax=Hwangdonia seohaensis TaxID=1240727 RepID=A0ABW3RD28_9FLAO|nr:hypothetical protein [Hwangdonia seohaensis]
MQSIKEHIAFKVITLCIAALFLVPSAVKFAHIFTHHTHEVCEGYNTTHIHKVDVDCDFYKFKLNKNFTYSFFYVDLFLEQIDTQQIASQYYFLSKYQRLQTSLRGPPTLI